MAKTSIAWQLVLVVVIVAIYAIGRCHSDTQMGGSCDSGICTYNESDGSALITEEKSTSSHVIGSRISSSVIYANLSAANQSEISNGAIFVHISEPGRNSRKFSILAGSAFENVIYVSHSNSMEMRFESDSDWVDLVLNYEEIPFERSERNETSASGAFFPAPFRGFAYRPNALTLLRLAPGPGAWNESSVSLAVEMLDVDEDAGEFLLVGSGTEPFQGPPAAYLTGKIEEPQNYYVATDEAYIALFSRSFEGQKSGFKVRWKRSGNRISDSHEDDEDRSIKDSVLQAVPICFYNASLIAEFNKTDGAEAPLPEFRQKFADLANRYAKERNLHILHEIKSDAVRLFRVSDVLPPRADEPQLRDGALYVMTTVTQSYDGRLAVFRAAQLAEILRRFDEYDGRSGHALMGFKVGLCPKGVDYRWWYLATTLMLLLCVALSIGVWICAYNGLWKSRRYKDRLKRMSELRNSDGKFAGNEYVAYVNRAFSVPKIKLTNQDGRSVSLSDDEESETELYNKNWILKKRQSEVEIHRRPCNETHTTNDQNTQIFVASVLNNNKGNSTKGQRLWRKNQMDDELLNCAKVTEDFEPTAATNLSSSPKDFNTKL